MIWLESYEPSKGTYEDHAAPETDYCRNAPLGTQSGTYFKTARTHEGMTVWRWGGLPPGDWDLIRRAARADAARDGEGQP